MEDSPASLQNAERFGELYTRTHLVVFRYIYALHGGPAQEVEDLTAETFIRAWRSRRRFSGNLTEALSWLLRIARNLVIDQHRHRKARGEQDNFDELEDFWSSTTAGSSPEEKVVQKDQFRILWSMIQALPDHKRDLIIMRYILGWNIKQIAEHSGMLENTVSVNILRILEKIRQDWAEAGQYFREKNERRIQKNTRY